MQEGSCSTRSWKAFIGTSRSRTLYKLNQPSKWTSSYYILYCAVIYIKGQQWTLKAQGCDTGAPGLITETLRRLVPEEGSVRETFFVPSPRFTSSKNLLLVRYTFACLEQNCPRLTPGASTPTYWMTSFFTAALETQRSSKHCWRHAAFGPLLPACR